MTDLDEAARAFRELVDIIRALRTPETGCPWDLEQDHRSLRPYLLEETYEVLDTIDRGDDLALREELGDLLLQIVLHAQLADDRSAFSITEVVRDIAAKMVRRHPHVFGSTAVSGSAEVLRNWEQIKAAEAQEKGTAHSTADKLDGLPPGLPALLQAQRLGEKAARTHGEPASVAELMAHVQQHLTDLTKDPAVALATRPPPEQALGDALFALCQLARRLGLSAEDSLRASSRRFVEQHRP